MKARLHIIGLIVLTLLNTQCRPKPTKSTLAVGGSETMDQMVEELYQSFKAKMTVDLHFKAEGSNIGFKHFLKGELALCNCSRELSTNELIELDKAGMHYRQFVIGIDAVAIIVHPKTGIDSLSTLQLKQIFQGQVSNWKQLGGNDLPIHIHGRNVHSGSYHYMKDHFHPKNRPLNYREHKSNEALIEAVELEMGAIGYCGIGAVKQSSGLPITSVWIANIYAEGEQATSPFQEQAVLSGKYPLVRPLIQLVNAKKMDVLSDFIRFELSHKGAELIRKSGYYPVPAAFEEFNKQALLE